MDLHVRLVHVCNTEKLHVLLRNLELLLAIASSNSYASFVLFKLRTCIHNLIYIAHMPSINQFFGSKKGEVEILEGTTVKLNQVVEIAYIDKNQLLPSPDKFLCDFVFLLMLLLCCLCLTCLLNNYLSNVTCIIVLIDSYCTVNKQDIYPYLLLSRYIHCIYT